MMSKPNTVRFVYSYLSPLMLGRKFAVLVRLLKVVHVLFIIQPIASNGESSNHDIRLKRIGPF